MQYRCYICGAIDSDDDDLIPIGIMVGKDEYQVCFLPCGHRLVHNCKEKFLTQVDKARKQIFEEMVRNNG